MEERELEKKTYNRGRANSIARQIELYITDTLLYCYRKEIEVNGKVITTPRIYYLLNKSGALGKDLDKVEIGITDDIAKMEQDVVQEITEELL